MRPSSVAAVASSRPSSSAPAEALPAPTLRRVDAVALVVGTVVGAGIFRTPSVVAAHAGSESTALLAWVVGAGISLVGALCYAELTTTYPSAGGDYHFLRRAFGARVSFLFAWARLSIIQTGSIAVLAFIIGDYAAATVPIGPVGPTLYAATTVIGVTAVNALGARQGKLAQNILTAAEVVGLCVVIAAGFLAPAAASGGAVTTDPSAAAGFGLVMVFVLLTYGGWNEAAYISAEVRGSRRSMAGVLVLSIVVIGALYVLVNAAYLRGLGLAGMAQSKAVAADLVERALGSTGGRLVSVLIVVAALTSVNAAVFTGARAAYALGRDHRSFALLGRWHGRAHTPVHALVVQGAVALILVVAAGLTRRGFETLVEYTAPVFWLFFLLSGVSLFVLRRRDPASARPFRVPLYPLTPLVFCGTCGYLLYASLVYTGTGALWGVAVLVVGGVVLGAMRRLEGGGT
jgi:APA family basic amino acid/polyamine antiporter